MPLDFRPLEASDADLLKAYIRDYYAFDKHEIDEAVIESAVREGLANPAHFRAWILRVDDRDAGYVSITIGFAIEAGGRDAFIDELYLEPWARGRGFGRQILDFCQTFCIEDGIRKLNLEVETHNARARRLYADWGFLEHDRFLMTKFVNRPR